MEFRNKEEAIATAVEFMQLHKDFIPGRNKYEVGLPRTSYVRVAGQPSLRTTLPDDMMNSSLPNANVVRAVGDNLTASLQHPVQQKILTFAIRLLISSVAAIIPCAAQTSQIAVTGTLTTEGVLCSALRTDDGALYTFRRGGPMAGFQPGDRIKIEGAVSDASICQQGVTVVVTKIERSN